ncbi:MAG: hypothetical protein WBD75_03060 [Phycisphaerae bacterium]
MKEFMKKHNMRDKDKGGKDDLLKLHALRMNEIVKKYGKKTIFWAGYQGPPQVARRRPTPRRMPPNTRVRRRYRH